MPSLKRTVLIVYCLTIFSACSKGNTPTLLDEAILNSLSIKELPNYSLDIDEKNKTVKGKLAYNPSYVNFLENGATLEFKISEKATIRLDGKNLNGKARLKKTLTDRTISVMGRSVKVKDTHFSGTISITAENGRTKQDYTLTIKMIGQEIDSSKLVESYHPTTKYIGVHRSKYATKAQLDRVYNGIKKVTNKLDPKIAKGLLDNNAKLLVISNEREAMSNPYFMQLLPLEGIYTNNGGKDESITDSHTGISTAELEFCYLTVYYAISVENSLNQYFSELKAAYKEAFDKGLFKPGPAYVDGYMDHIHARASKDNVLKYGSFMFNLYKVYYTSNTIDSKTKPEYKVYNRSEILSKNPLAHQFMKAYFDISK